MGGSIGLWPGPPVSFKGEVGYVRLSWEESIITQLRNIVILY